MHRVRCGLGRAGGQRHRQGHPSANLVAWIILSKYIDHLPLHRIASQFKRWGVEIAETTLRVQKGETDRKGVGKASVDYLWAMLGRGTDGTPLGVSFLYEDGRSHAVAKSILSGVKGCVLTDAYEGYIQASKGRDDLVHGLCWAHARRKYHEAFLCGDGQAVFAIQRIADLYVLHHRIEALTSSLGRRWGSKEMEVDQSRVDAIIVDRRRKWMAPVVDELEEWNSRRQQIARRYLDAFRPLASAGKLAVPVVAEWADRSRSVALALHAGQCGSRFSRTVRNRVANASQISKRPASVSPRSSAIVRVSSPGLPLP